MQTMAFVDRLEGINRYYQYFKLFAWVVFLAGFAPVCLANGMHAAAALLAVLGLLVNHLVFRKLELPISDELHSRITLLLYLEHVVVLLVSAWFLTRPIEGVGAGAHSWKIIPNTEHPDPVLLMLARERLAVLRTRRGGAEVLQSRDGGKTWRNLRYPGLFGWCMFFDAKREELWVGPNKGNRVHFYRFKTGRWISMPRPAGYIWSISVINNVPHLTVRGELFRLREGGWVSVHRGNVKTIVASPDRKKKLILSLGRRWRESSDGGKTWRDVTATGADLLTPRGAVGGGGRRYVFEGGVFRGRFYAAGPGERFQERELPAPDIRVMVASPADGRDIWIGSWGQGIFRSRDAGRTWRYMGLRGIQVRSMALDIESRKIYAASSNLLFRHGIYVMTFK